MQLEESIKNTIEFIRSFCDLNNSSATPSLSENIMHSNYVEQQARAWFSHDSFERDNFISSQTVNNVKSRYNSLTPKLETYNLKEFQNMISNLIPDSKDYVLVDIGSDLGREFTRPFANKHPSVQVYMIDKFDIDHLKERHVHNSVPTSKGFEKRVDITTPEETMNKLLDANGFKNVHYLDKYMLHSPESGTNLTELESALKGKNVVFTGWRNPSTLGFVTSNEATYHNAKYLFSTLTALERSSPNDYNMQIFKSIIQPLTSKKEADKLVSLLVDADYKTRNTEKYDYSHDGERYFAVGLKQLVNLAVCSVLQDNNYNTKLLLNLKNDDRILNYNQENHLIYASKNKIK